MTQAADSRRGLPTVAPLTLTAVCAVARLPALRSLPIFGDEAIKLHWAQLIREDPLHYALVSMEAPLPPLHSWLLALAFPLSADPLRAGRLLSVLFAALTVVFFYFFCVQLATTFARESTVLPQQPRRAALAACVLLVFCPYLALHQRLAMVEALFVLESVAVAWLALKMAQAPQGKVAMALGFAMGAAMLTRQNLSYVLSLLPVLAFFLMPKGKRPSTGRFAGLLLVSFFVALGLWLPVLLKETGASLTERLIHTRLLAEPMSAGARLRMAYANGSEILRWLWTYMTPPILLLSVLSFAWLVSRRAWRASAFLLTWLILILGPLLLFGRFLFSRYGVLAAIPLLAASGTLLGGINEAAALRSLSLRRKGAVVAGFFSLLLLWPIRDIGLAARDWREQPLVPRDRWQFVSGWPAGAATEAAVKYLRRLSREREIVLLIPRNEGNPMDTLWLYFSGARRVRAYSVGDIFREPLLRKAVGPGNRFLVDGDPWRRLPARAVSLPEDLPIYHVSPEPIYTLQGAGAADVLLRERNPQIQEVARFGNPLVGQASSDGVVLYRLR